MIVGVRNLVRSVTLQSLLFPERDSGFISPFPNLKDSCAWSGLPRNIHEQRWETILPNTSSYFHRFQLKNGHNVPGGFHQNSEKNGNETFCNSGGSKSMGTQTNFQTRAWFVELESEKEANTRDKNSTIFLLREKVIRNLRHAVFRYIPRHMIHLRTFYFANTKQFICISAVSGPK